MDTSNCTLSGASGNSATDTPANALQRGVESAGSALHSSIDKMANPARSTVDRVSSAAHETVDTLASGASRVADRFSDQTSRIADAPGRALGVSKSWVQGRPFEAVAAALAFGFIVGRLTSR